MALEREHKFLLAGDPPSFETLRAELSARGFSLQETAPRDQRDRYFDTPARDLKRAGVSLRTREFGNQKLATFKAAGEVTGSLHRREELELPFQAPWPEPILKRVTKLAPLESLRPVLELRTRRVRYLVHDKPHGQGARVAELSFDAVRAQRPDTAREVSFQELELEALGASEEAFAEVAETIETRLSLQPSTQNKLEHALMLLESA